MEFTGFSDDTLRFLAELAQHNDRAWFDANRERYERELLAPQRAFVDAIGAEFSAIDPLVHCEPAVNRSIYRINRDTRFSRDKSPYKTYADMWFWRGVDRKLSPGYFVRIVPEAIWVGGGRHFMRPEDLAKYRAAVIAEDTGSELAETMGDLAADGYTLGEQTLKRVPRGFDAGHPRADLLRYTAVHAIEVAKPAPAEFTGTGFVDWCMARFERTRPLIEWLDEVL